MYSKKASSSIARTCCTKMCAFSDANAKDAMTVEAKTPKSTVFTTGDDDTKTLVVVVVLGDEDMMTTTR